MATGSESWGSQAAQMLRGWCETCFFNVQVVLSFRFAVCVCRGAQGGSVGLVLVVRGSGGMVHTFFFDLHLDVD